MTDHTDGETIQSSWAYDKNDQALYVMQDGKVMGFGYNGVGEIQASGTARAIRWKLKARCAPSRMSMTIWGG